MATLVIGVTGASGVTLAHQIIDVLTEMGHHVHLVMTRDGAWTAREELGPAFATVEKFISGFSKQQQERIITYKIQDSAASIASGSFPVDGMIIIPCSMASLAAVAAGLGDNLLRRAADVTLKERRRLVLVPRETPLSEIHLQNMLTLTRMGAIMVPPVPAWYLKPTSLREVERAIIGRVLDLFHIDAGLFPRWKG
jgi:4-hydroxy-3-polyprenylbenzoate decarboxylase